MLAAGCLMPGFAEAASFQMDYGTKDTDYTEVENIATIIKDIGGESRWIYWKPGDGEAIVKDCTINVDPITIEPGIDIYGGYTSGNGAVTGNTVTIKGTTFTSTSYPSNSYIYGGRSKGGNANNNAVEISDNTTFNNLL